MVTSTRKRTTSNVVATSIGCSSRKLAYEAAVAQGAKTWDQVEDRFLRAMEVFDANVASGLANMGALQNGKGDFFNDLLAVLLENCAGVELFSRGGVRGLRFPKHNLDPTFPGEGVVEFLLEAKTVGTPRHPGSQRQRPIGRAGAADLEKRVKEIGFKAIDLKAEYARILAALGQSPTVIAGDLTTWLRTVRPRYYLFIAARVINEKKTECA